MTRNVNGSENVPHTRIPGRNLPSPLTPPTQRCCLEGVSAYGRWKQGASVGHGIETD